MVKEKPPRNGTEKEVTGPRGGKTTVTEGMFRKNLWISQEQNERLRYLAFRTRRSEADLIRQGLELVLTLAKDANEEEISRGDRAEHQGEEEERR